jgi:cysteine desulfurase family protein (TIGR01976 family)
MSLDLKRIREQFPALDRPAIFLDNPGGTQIVKHSLDRINRYLIECNANHEGAFETSQKSDAILDAAHQAMADFLNAPRREEIVFGPNMTTLTLSLSRALARTLGPGDEIVITRLDHDANVAPWLLIAEDKGCQVTWIDFDVEDCTLNLDEFEKALARKPKIVAFGYASNAVGTINPVKQIVKMAQASGALTYVDAVQYAPHGPIDVQDIGCDFLVCSAYKFFGPHMGALYGKYDLLDSLRAYKVRPASDLPPGKFETGTQNHEGIAGVLGTVEYFEWVGEKLGGAGGTRRQKLVSALNLLGAHELQLSHAIHDALKDVPGIHIYGITDPDQFHQRVPTFSFRLKDKHPRAVAEALGKAGIYVWDGNYYALSVTQRLGVEDQGGMIRVGAAHYNTLEEIDRFGETLKKIAR